MASSQYSTNLTIPSFDELFDDDLTLKIPPLRSMFPAISSERLDTLEPSTKFHQDEQSSRLTGRQMALAQAKSMEDLKPSDLEALKPIITPAPEAPMMNRPLDVHNRKRRKLAREEQVLEFVTLPKPKPRPKLEEANKKPFRPIAVLNQLNEPPPSAALFPPITPSQDMQQLQESDHARQCNNDSQAEVDAHTSNGTPVKAKRRWLRSRQMWTEAETSDLLEGVAIMGVGRWKDILTHPKFHFQDSRTYVDLKDRFRVLFPQAQPEKWGDVGNQPDYDLKLRFKRTNRRKTPSGQKLPYRSWSESEDVELHKGFHKYGYQWHLIAQDGSLNFDDRNGNQIRDRFRRLHPQLYTDTPFSENQDNQPKRGRGRPPGKKKVDGASVAAQSTDNAQCQAINVNDKHGATIASASTAPAFLDGLLNSSYNEPESEFSRSLAELDNDLGDNIDDSLTLPPVQWDEMAVQPIFDLG